MKEFEQNPNLRGKQMLNGVTGAAFWAAITMLAILPLHVTITTGIYLGVVGLTALLFGLVQVLEKGATEFFNKYQQARATNMDDLLKGMKKFAAEFDDDGNPVNISENSEGN